MQDKYKKQTELLIEILSLINWDKCFALKGGTAINFFIEPLPRLSVDIDLAYIYVTDRDKALEEMKKTLKEYAAMFRKHKLSSELTGISAANPVGKLRVSSAESSIIIEPNINLRGTLLPPEKKLIDSRVSDLFMKEVEVSMLAEPELFAGKLLAMLDRQHPRDIFDMYWYIKKTNNTLYFIDYFIVYLVQTNRPFHEILSPNLLDISLLYENSFRGMTEQDITIESLLQTREEVIEILHRQINKNHIGFLISLLEDKPNWPLLPFPDINLLPGVKWRLMNIKKMTAEKRKLEISKLRKLYS